MTAASTSSSSTSTAAQGHEQELKVVSFNILAPCYHRLKDTGQMEADSPDIYLARNRLIVQQLLSTEADVICLQEFWCASDELRRLYTDALCGPGGAGYSVRELRRTSHWRVRADGLACFVKDSRLVIQDTRQILFHDCGDRVAQMFLLALRPPPAPPGTGTGPGGRAPAALPAQQFIVVNTHLLFPHNEYSTKIRLRELAKVRCNPVCMQTMHSTSFCVSPTPCLAPSSSYPADLGLCGFVPGAGAVQHHLRPVGRALARHHRR